MISPQLTPVWEGLLRIAKYCICRLNMSEWTKLFHMPKRNSQLPMQPRRKNAQPWVQGNFLYQALTFWPRARMIRSEKSKWSWKLVAVLLEEAKVWQVFDLPVPESNWKFWISFQLARHSPKTESTLVTNNTNNGFKWIQWIFSKFALQTSIGRVHTGFPMFSTTELRTKRCTSVTCGWPGVVLWKKWRDESR